MISALLAEWLAEVDGPNRHVALRWIVPIYSYEGLLYTTMGRDAQAAVSFGNARAWLLHLMETGAARILAVDAAEEEGGSAGSTASASSLS